MSEADRSDGLDPDLLATTSNPAWVEIRCAFPVEGTPPALLVPWQPLAASVRSWRETGLCDAFIFVRKPPGLRLRFSRGAARKGLDAALSEWLSEMTRQHHVVSHAQAVYEPEEHRFGGPVGMAIAHGLWSADAESVLEYECLGRARRGSVSRAALWAIIVNDLLRVTLEDAAEIWDVWCRLADAIRRWDVDGRDVPQSGYRAMAAALFDPSTQWLALLRPDVRLFVERGRAANRSAGEALRALMTQGGLRTGRRAWLAANALFQANRWGLGLHPTDLRAVTLAMEHLLQPERATARSHVRHRIDPCSDA